MEALHAECDGRCLPDWFPQIDRTPARLEEPCSTLSALELVLHIGPEIDLNASGLWLSHRSKIFGLTTGREWHPRVEGSTGTDKGILVLGTE